jgi:dTMP kinase
MKVNGFLVCFSGIDGSGKTTLSKSLVDALNEKGIECAYVYGRLEPLILRPPIWIGRKIFVKKKVMSGNQSQYLAVKRRAIKKHAFLSRVYKYILLFDYSLQLLFKVRLPHVYGKNIICDRYVYDTVVNDIALDMELSTSEIRDLVKKLFYVAPKPDIAFLIDLPEEIALQRKNDIPSLEYLRERRKLYLAIGDEFKMMILDGTKNLKEMENLILKVISSKSILG